MTAITTSTAPATTTAPGVKWDVRKHHDGGWQARALLVVPWLPDPVVPTDDVFRADTAEGAWAWVRDRATGQMVGPTRRRRPAHRATPELRGT